MSTPYGSPNASTHRRNNQHINAGVRSRHERAPGAAKSPPGQKAEDLTHPGSHAGLIGYGHSPPGRRLRGGVASGGTPEDPADHPEDDERCPDEGGDEDREGEVAAREEADVVPVSVGCY
jgi:hypothetical protein